MRLDEINRLVAKAIAVRILYPHMQKTDKEQVRIHCQSSGMVGRMQLFLGFGTLVDQTEFCLDTGTVR